MKRLFGVLAVAGVAGLMQPVFGDAKGGTADEAVKLPERRWTTDVEYVAHQGEESLAPSHSRPAYAFAVEHGLERIKLDLQETKDGEVVLQHDATLKAIMGWNVKIKDVTLAEIREKGRCKTVGGFRGETIVTLAEALEYGKKTKKGVWLDFKHFSPAFMKKVFSICEAAGLPHDRIMIATWTKPALRYAMSNYPDVARVAHTWIRRKPDGSGFTTNSGKKDKVYATEDELIAELLRHRDELKLTGFNLPHIVRKGRVVYHTTEKVVRALKAAGCWVSIWFVDDPFTGELYRNFGADCFVTSWAARTKRDFVETPDFRDKINWNRVDVKGWPEAETSASGSDKAGEVAAVRMPEGGICGHQGNCKSFPGNTVEGIADAVRLGVAMVEFDARRSKDGAFVLSHEGSVKHPTLGKKLIRDLTLAELKECVLRRGKSEYRVATLDEALDVIPTNVWIDLHCYCGTRAMGELARHIRERGLLRQTCFCGNLKGIDTGRAAVPDLIANNCERPGPRDRDWTDAECQKFIDDAVAQKCRFLQLSRPWPRKFSDAAHAAGVRVILYRCDDPSQLPDLKARGIDFVMTNHPADLVKAFDELNNDTTKGVK